MDITKIINDLEERLQSYLSEIECSCLEYTPYIVEVGALTASTSESGRIIIQ
jgi:hypothetical protein